jgi:hypothetical protein
MTAAGNCANQLVDEVSRLQRENAALKARIAQLETIERRRAAGQRKRIRKVVERNETLHAIITGQHEINAHRVVDVRQKSS